MNTAYPGLFCKLTEVVVRCISVQTATHQVFPSLTNGYFSHSYHCLHQKEPEDVDYLSAFSPVYLKPNI